MTDFPVWVSSPTERDLSERGMDLCRSFDLKDLHRFVLYLEVEILEVINFKNYIHNSQPLISGLADRLIRRKLRWLTYLPPLEVGSRGVFYSFSTAIIYFWQWNVALLGSGW